MQVSLGETQSGEGNKGGLEGASNRNWGKGDQKGERNESFRYREKRDKVREGSPDQNGRPAPHGTRGLSCFPRFLSLEGGGGAVWKEPGDWETKKRQQSFYGGAR